MAQPCSGPRGRLGRPGDLRGPFHLRAIRTGPTWPWGCGGLPCPRARLGSTCGASARQDHRVLLMLWAGQRGPGQGPCLPAHAGSASLPAFETCLRAVASPASGALLDPAGPLTFLARVLCPHPPKPRLFSRRFRLRPVLPPPPLPQRPRTEAGGGARSRGSCPSRSSSVTAWVALRG